MCRPANYKQNLVMQTETRLKSVSFVFFSESENYNLTVK